MQSDEMKKKITYVITRATIGGAQFHTLDLIKNFKDEYDVLLVAGSDGVLIDEAKKINVRVKVIPELDSLNILFATLRLYQTLSVEKPDLVHVHSSLASVYARLAAGFARLKTLYTVHGWHFSHEPSFFKKSLKIGAEKTLKAFTSYWIVVSSFDARLGDKYRLFKAGKVSTVPNGVQQSKNKVCQKQSSPLPVVFVGRFTYQKNCESAIKVIEHTRSDLHLTMYVSTNDVDSLKSLVERSSSKSKISLVLNQSNASEEVHKHSVMLVTSRYEGMPLGVLEAMREGLAVVSTDVCGMNEVVYNDVNGYLLPENSEKRMAEMLDFLASNHNALLSMQEGSKNIFEENFTLTKMLEANSNIYKELLF